MRYWRPSTTELSLARGCGGCYIQGTAELNWNRLPAPAFHLEFLTMKLPLAVFSLLLLAALLAFYLAEWLADRGPRKRFGAPADAGRLRLALRRTQIDMVTSPHHRQ